MRIRCTGYVDERLIQADRIGQVMDDIETWVIKRPEFEIAGDGNSEESSTFVAALFRVSPEVGLEGWFVWKSLGRTNLAYSLKSASAGSAVYKHVLLCGAAERIHFCAILTKRQAMDLFSSLIEGTANERFDCLPFSSVLLNFPPWSGE
jgi:hypothetical protein